MSTTDAVLALLIGFIVIVGLWAYYWVRRSGKIFLTGELQKVEIVDIVALSHDTYKYRFALPSHQGLGWPPAVHVDVYSPNAEAVEEEMWNGKPDRSADFDELVRPYSPVTGDEAVGYFELVVKVYRPNDVFVDGGRVSQYWDRLKVGDFVKMRGLKGRVTYMSGGRFFEKSVEVAGRKRNIGMIAGGTGITALLQIIRKIVDSTDEWDQTIELSVVIANKSEDDILCADIVKEYEAKAQGRLKVWYTIDYSVQRKGTWKYSVGYVTNEMLSEHLAAPSADGAVLVCGPGPMVEMAQKLLVKIGHAKDAILLL